MPLLAIPAAAKVASTGYSLVKSGWGKKAWSKAAKWGKAQFKKGFTLNAGDTTVWKRPSGTSQNEGASFVPAGGMNSTTLIALGIGAYLLFKK
jgi:hypothetical protein